MAIVDIVCGAVLLIFAIIGIVRGFARQVFGFFTWIIAIIGAFFLLKPVYELLMGISIVKGWQDALGTALSSVTFLNGLAEKLGRIGAGNIILSEYVFKLILFIVLAVVITIVYKLITKLIITVCDLPIIRIVDKTLGFALALAIGALILGVLLYIVYVLETKVPSLQETISNFRTQFIPEDSLVGKYVYANLDKVAEYLKQTVQLIIGKISAQV